MKLKRGEGDAAAEEVVLVRSIIELPVTGDLLRQLVLGKPSSTENSLLFDSDTMLLNSSVTKWAGWGVTVVVVDFSVVVVTVVVALGIAVVVSAVDVFCVVFSDSGSMAAVKVDSKVGGRVTTFDLRLESWCSTRTL